jgi:TolB-like protein
VAKEVEKKLAFRFDSAGRQKVKNIEEPIDVYHVRIDASSRRRVLQKRGIRRLWWALGVPAAVVVLLAAWMALYYPGTVTTPVVSNTIPSVAVLPFKDLSVDKSLGYLGEGVANDVIAILSRFSDIAVVSRTSSFAYQDKEGDIRQIGRELGVGYVVEGSVRKEGERVRIVAQLVNAKSGDHVWADRFDKSGTDPWALQDELTGKIVGAMTGEFGAIRKADYSQAWGKDSTNLAEYDYYLRAESQLNLYTKEGLERSGEISRQGLQVFPGSPLLTVELGWSHWLKVALLHSSDPQQDLQEAERLVNQVLADKNLSPQVTRLANWLNAWLLTLKRDHDGAVVAMNKAIAAAPYNAFTLTDAASIFLQAGQSEKALELTDVAAARDPGLSWFVNYVRGFIFIVLGKNEDAVEVLKTTEFADAPLQLAIAYMRLGRQADARAAVEKMLKSAPGATIQSWRQTWNFSDPKILDQAAADLARAGLPGSPTQ